VISHENAGVASSTATRCNRHSCGDLISELVELYTSDGIELQSIGYWWVFPFPVQHRRLLSRFRTSSHDLAIETGRYVKYAS
jgi:hypothetical protein